MKGYLDFSLSTGATLEERPQRSAEAQAAIDAFLAEKEPRRFEMGASASFDAIQLYLSRKGIMAEQLAGSNKYRLNGRRCGFAQVLARADKCRIEDGLAPLARVV